MWKALNKLQGGGYLRYRDVRLRPVLQTVGNMMTRTEIDSEEAWIFVPTVILFTREICRVMLGCLATSIEHSICSQLG